MERRRARINDHTLIGADEFGTGAADGFLGIELMRIASGEGEFVGLRGHDAGATVSAL